MTAPANFPPRPNQRALFTCPFHKSETEDTEEGFKPWG